MAVNNGAAVNVSGNVSISSESQGDADAQTPGSVGGLVGLVATFATATLTPTVASFIGTTSITAGGGIALQSIHNFSGTNPVTSRNAHAVSTPSGGGLLAGVGGSATATANATVDTTVSSGAVLTSDGDVSLISLALIVAKTLASVQWEKLKFDTTTQAYHVSITEAELAKAPSYAADQDFDWGDRTSEIALHNYYGARPYWGI